ncbi:LuxR C-terminal-related transcriptional regulator [Xanthomonas campestris pv. raphani]|uniref:LuxR C-terminal-related transcriptional regulator n=1 Tax=Xanthomonas campestris TaxID=339 RepID=UPI002367CAF1|nr:LuxR C-terminal-related transcriptional regulator [Xanthomonas campestris]MEA9822124.1 LuxR C-terminal-related transcriptional regulator [Xanthomonas campestris pv. raphani]MEA9850434.1 LuxR C-terminal-related transcriptional regulator [Xanthomonas campestris pv. raphani]MEA9854536.1 LuxR C-terminal-related transcriptional regulator [Xanthomonas campestris pv. raphani]MEA9963565.1 LuxR C-terminal-related transcriptional regulator [Xanthomonas campestris pv. raphani]WDJ23280.1 tetratricopept
MLKPVALLTPRPSPLRDLTLPDWLLASKLEPPLPRAGAVVRGGLLAVLDQAQARPLTLLLAPPGFGKSTLLTQWHAQLLAREPAAVAWLSLDEEDAEPARFLGHLALALQGAGADPALCAPALHGRDHDPRDALNALIRALRAAPRRISVILDDYDRPGGSAIDELVLRLIEHAGGRLHLLLSTRRVPGLPLARLELQAQLTRVGSSELALDEDEAQALLGAQVAAPVVDELRRYTEGWPVALHLARLWLEGGAQRQQEVATRFSGRNAQIAAYLAEQVVNDLDADTRDLLLRTSPLERVNAALADAVRQRDDSGRLLAGLEHFHGLLIPLDGEREWFRYHPLFADFLQQLLDREHPAGALQIHQRAARWFGEHQYLSDAVRHASRGECGDLAASYVARAGTWQLLLTHGTHQVRALLRHFDHRTIRDTPALNLTQAHLHMKLGEFSHARLLLERFRDFPAALREPLQRDYTVVVAALRERLDEICGNPHGLTQIAGQAAALDEDDHLGRGMLLCICATTALAQGGFALAERYAHGAREAMGRGGSELGTGHALLVLGQSFFYRGRLGDAEACYQQALNGCLHAPQPDRVLQATAHCLLAQLHYERGHHDDAADLLHPALDILEQHDGSTDVLAAGYATALGLERLRDHSGRSAAALLEHVEQIAHGRKLARLSELAAAWRLMVMLEHPGNAAIDVLIARTGGESGLAHTLRSPHRWRDRAAMGFALARWHRLAGRSSAALTILGQIEQACLASDNLCHLARTRARIALVLQQRGELAAALPYLYSALDHVALTRSWQAIAELGLPAKAMLRSLRQHDPQTVGGTTRALTIQALLDRLSGDDDPANDLFSERELEVLAQLARGYSNKQIARCLHLSENTVKFHLKNVYRKLDARSREGALAQALQRGLLREMDPPTGPTTP